MRRTDDQTILEMKQDGKTGKEIAAFFKVSGAYISKRLKRLQPVKEPESFANLSEKQKKFVLAKVEGKSNVDAAVAAFDVTTRDSAKALGHTMMKDPDVGKAIQNLMAEEGIGRRRRIQRLKDVIESKDLSIAAKGLDLSWKLDGGYAPIKVDGGIDIEAVKKTVIYSDSERRRLEVLRVKITNRSGENGKEGG